MSDSNTQVAPNDWTVLETAFSDGAWNEMRSEIEQRIGVAVAMGVREPRARVMLGELMLNAGIWLITRQVGKAVASSVVNEILAWRHEHDNEPASTADGDPRGA